MFKCQSNNPSPGESAADREGGGGAMQQVTGIEVSLISRRLEGRRKETSGMKMYKCQTGIQWERSSA